MPQVDFMEMDPLPASHLLRMQRVPMQHIHPQYLQLGELSLHASWSYRIKDQGWIIVMMIRRALDVE